MKLTSYKISLVIFFILLVSAVIPVIPVLLAYSNGALLGGLGYLVGFDGPRIALPFNLVMAIVSITIYYFVRSVTSRIITALFATFFLNGFVMFFFERYLINSNIYDFGPIILAGIIGGSLVLADFLRVKTKSQ